MPLGLKASTADSPSSFRIRWFGYDRGEVDEALRQGAADRQHLQESLARLDSLVASYGHDSSRATLEAARREADEIRTRAHEEAQRVLRQAEDGADRLQRERLQTSRREVERLTTLRLEVAGCLETSIAALHKATDLLTTGTETKDFPQRGLAVANARVEEPTPDFPAHGEAAHPRLTTLIIPACVASAVLVLLTYQFLLRDSSISVATAAPKTEDVTIERADERVQPYAATPAGEPNEKAAVAESPVQSTGTTSQTEGLVLTLTARRPCWIETILDGGQNMGRLLKPDETIILYAHDETVLRLGDAGAVSALINSQPAKPFGADGQVTTKRITRANYASFLAAATPQAASRPTASSPATPRIANAF